MLTKRFFLLYLLFVITSVSIAQPSNDPCYKSFLKTYTIANGNLEFKDVCRTSDDGYVVTGIKAFFGRIILKLNKRGEVVWSTIDDYPYSANRVLESNDGGIIVGGYNTQKSQIMKFSSSGTIVWAKEFLLGSSGGNSFTLFDLKQTADGSFVLIFNGDFGGGYSYNFIVKLDSSGNLIWCKELLHDIHLPFLKSLLIENNAIYIAADFYNASIGSIDVAKLDLTTGNFIWKKRLQINGPYLFEPQLILINDELCISTIANYLSGSTITNKSCIIKLNANTGNLLPSFIFENPHLSYNVTYYAIHHMGPSHCTKTSDNNLIIAQLTYQNTDTVFNVTKFTPTGSIIWSKNYKNYKKHDVWNIKSDGEGILIVGRRYVAYPNTTDAGFFMRLNNNGNVTEQTANPTEDCYNEGITALTQPFPITEMPASNFLTTNTISYLSTIPYTATIIPGSILVNEACHSVDTSCTTLSILGPSIQCLDSTLITFTALRNPGCTNPVTWTFDTSFINAVQFTDSTIKLQFRRKGTAALNAKVQGSCSTIYATKMVQIYRNANSLNLGPDQRACFPSTLELNAKKGFASYLWNNGTTDSTLSVSMAGTYFLKVVDSCGNVGRDTIIIDDFGTVPINLGADRQKCNNDTIQFNAPPGFANYFWGPNYNISNPQPYLAIVNPATDTNYFLKVVTSNGCFGYDTIKVTVKTSPPIILGLDKSICTGDSILLDAGTGFIEYNWNNGNTTQQLPVYTTGQYTISAKTAEGCYSYDTLRILNTWANPVVSLPKNPALCFGNILMLDAGNFSSYLWNTGAISQTISVSTLGFYTVKVTDNNGCKGFDTTNITNIFPIPHKFLSADTSLCIFETLNTGPTAIFRGYQWNTGSTSPNIDVSEPGLYWLMVKDNNGCIGRDSIVVNRKVCSTGFFMPSAFSPNKDGKNDVLKPLLFGNIKKYVFSIYNRWGKPIFNTSEYGKGWDGKINGQVTEGNVFVWTCSYQFEGEVAQNKKGTVFMLK